MNLKCRFSVIISRKEINVPGMIAPIIICADFYRIIEKPEDRRLYISDEFLTQLNATPLQYNRSKFRMITAGEFFNLTELLIFTCLESSNSYIILSIFQTN